ncbi:hypothetical protein ACHAXR_007364 [Thalassiosira sp. AJA248-18]
MDEDCLPLGAQHQHQHQCNGDQDTEEEEHFQQVCNSYRQYATFHQTRQQGVHHRMHQMLNSSRHIVEEEGGPTIESILPPSLRPQTVENQQYQKSFCDATIRNQFFLDNVLKYSGVMTSQEVLRQRRESNDGGAIIEWATEDQMSKIDSVLKSLARDWSAEGREERSVVYDRLVGALEKYMPLDGSGVDGETFMDDSIDERLPPRLAVPGSGLGRLAWEIFSKGYSVQGSDFSLPMLLASDFMLNGCGVPSDGEPASVQNGDTFKQFGVSPWIAETKNSTSFQHRLRTVVVPDVDPTSLQYNNDDDRLAAPEFTMMAGEFLSLYSHFLPDHHRTHNGNCHKHGESPEKFNAVVCSFFLDTAPSLPHYLLTIYHMLEDGGLLLNFGPLMYHWSGHGGLIPGDLDNQTGDSNGGNKNAISSMYQNRNKHLDPRYLSSIDYTWEEVRYMIRQCGFEIEEEEMYIPARYTSDAKRMMKVVYDCVFLVARKKPMGRK